MTPKVQQPPMQQDQWTTATTLQQQESADCGMMPPPNSTLTLNIRRSSSGGIIGGGLNDQLSPSSSSTCSSNCSLKVEIHDESSQGSLCEMPVPLVMMPTVTDGAMTVKQEDMAVVQQQLAHHNLLMNGVHLGNQVAPSSSAVAAVAAAVAPIQFTDQQMTTISQAINATTTNPATSSVMDVGAALHMDTSGGVVAPNHVQPVNLMTTNCSASDIILNSHSVILGAPSNVTSSGVVVDQSVNTSPNGGLPVGTIGALNGGSLSSDVILNPSVSPTLLCDTLAGAPVAVPVVATTAMIVDPMMTLASSTVATSNSVDPMLAAPSVVVDPMMGNSPTSAMQSPQSPNGSTGSGSSSNSGLATTAEVVQNVQNMILNAAAEILVSQQTTISTESMQAIISLNNAASMLNDQPQQQQEVAAVVNAGMYSSPPPATEDPNMAMMGRRNSNIAAEAAVGGASEMLEVVPGDIHMRTVHEDIGHLGG